MHPRSWGTLYSRASYVLRHMIFRSIQCLHGLGHTISSGMQCFRAYNVSGHPMSRGIQCVGAYNVSVHSMSWGIQILPQILWLIANRNGRFTYSYQYRDMMQKFIIDQQKEDNNPTRGRNSMAFPILGLF